MILEKCEFFGKTMIFYRFLWYICNYDIWFKIIANYDVLSKPVDFCKHVRIWLLFFKFFKSINWFGVLFIVNKYLSLDFVNLDYEENNSDTRDYISGYARAFTFSVIYETWLNKNLVKLLWLIENWLHLASVIVKANLQQRKLRAKLSEPTSYIF